MRPRWSLFGALSREGRFRNRWARGLAQKNLSKAREKLRSVIGEFERDPEGRAPYWSDFLASLVEAERARALDKSDLATLERIGIRLASSFVLTRSRPRHEQRGLGADEALLPIVALHDARGERGWSEDLLVRLHGDRASAEALREQCVRMLTSRGATSAAALAVYAEHLERQSQRGRLGLGRQEPKVPKKLLRLLEQWCRAQLEGDGNAIDRAGKLAQRLIHARVEQAWLHEAAGLRALKVTRDPAEAARHFESALEADSENQDVRRTWVVALVEAGLYDEAERAVDGRDSADAVLRDLRRLAAAFAWLDSDSAGGPAPVASDEMEARGLVGTGHDLARQARGRLLLIEGDAKEAAEILRPLAERRPEDARVAYHASWAEVLSGERRLLAQRFLALERHPQRWTLACLLIDADPAAARKHGAVQSLDSAPEPCLGAVRARASLSRAERPERVDGRPGPTRQTLDSAPAARGPLAPEEKLEAHRTALARHVKLRDRQALERALAHPLFQRLPRADRLLWEGTAALLAQTGRGRDLLETAAFTLGHERAALVLAVHHLQEGRGSEARRCLDVFAGRNHPRVELLRAYLEAGEERWDAATRRLKALDGEGTPRAPYLLGRVYLCQARRASSSSARDVLTEHARVALTRAGESGTDALPADAEALARCVEFAADPVGGLEACGRLWAQVQAWPHGRRQPWIAWNTALAHVGCAGPQMEHSAADELIEKLAEADTGASADCRLALARALTRAAFHADQPERAEALAGMVDRLADGDLRTLPRLSVAAAARRRYTAVASTDADKAGRHLERVLRTDPGNPGLALLRAASLIDAGDRAAAASVLAAADEGAGDVARLARAISTLVSGRAPDADAVAAADSRGGFLGAVAQLVGAAAAFAEGRTDAGLDGLAAALRIHDVSAIVDGSRALPLLCARVAGGRVVPEALRDAVKQMLGRAADDADPLRLARCAAAVGEADSAARWYERALVRSRKPELCEEVAALFCHAAVIDERDGRVADAARRLRRAASLGRGDDPPKRR